MAIKYQEMMSEFKETDFGKIPIDWDLMKRKHSVKYVLFS